MVDLFFQIVLNNVCISLALAIIAAIVGITLKRPAITYLLWLLVFVKLLTPPFLMISVNQDLWMSESTPTIDLNLAEQMDIQIVANSEIGETIDLSPVAMLVAKIQKQHWLLIAWIFGSMAVLIWSARQVIRFHRLLKKEAEAGGPEIQLTATEIAASLGLKSVPEIHTVSANISPMVWWIGGKVRVVVPTAILEQLSTEQSKWILSHELAHIRRRDHIIRWIEWLVCVCFWWNPVTWWARYNLRANEELCCDAMVLSIMKPGPYTYGDSLLKALEIITCPPHQPLAMASGINNNGLLKGRINMIVSNDLIKSKMRWLQTCIMLGALIVIPLGLTNAQSSATNGAPSEVLSVEAKAALVEAQQRLETAPNDFAAAREPLMAYFNTHPYDSIPKTMYQMLGQLWYVDQMNEEHLETANWVYETAYEIYPDDTSFLLNYAVTTYELQQYEDAAVLFEDYYYLDESHDIKFLENAAGLYMMSGNEEAAAPLYESLYLLDESNGAMYLKNLAVCYMATGDDEEAQRVLSLLEDIPQTSEPPEKTWEDLPERSWEDLLISGEAPALLSDVDTKPQVLEAFPPPYPEDAKASGIEGRVTLRFVVDTDGYAKGPEIVEATPADIFDDAALEAIALYRFQPATIDGMQVACIVKLPLVFEMD